MSLIQHRRRTNWDTLEPSLVTMVRTYGQLTSPQILHPLVHTALSLEVQMEPFHRSMILFRSQKKVLVLHKRGNYIKTRRAVTLNSFLQTLSQATTQLHSKQRITDFIFVPLHY